MIPTRYEVIRDPHPARTTTLTLIALSHRRIRELIASEIEHFDEHHPDATPIERAVAHARIRFLRNPDIRNE
jgi:hypothetical protein